MTALALLTRLRDSGIELTPTCSAGRPLVFGLHVKSPVGVLTDALRLAIREHKAALIDLLEAFEERVAIAEYCGGLTRAVAEQLAWHCLCDSDSETVVV